MGKEPINLMLRYISMRDIFDEDYQADMASSGHHNSCLKDHLYLRILGNAVKPEEASLLFSLYSEKYLSSIRD